MKLFCQPIRTTLKQTYLIYLIILGVEYVLIVGVGGGVPHYTDYNKHVRLGDVVMSSPSFTGGQKFIYQYCQTARVRDAGEVRVTS